MLHSHFLYLQLKILYIIIVYIKFLLKLIIDYEYIFYQYDEKKNFFKKLIVYCDINLYT
jgi:hypothetical protein